MIGNALEARVKLFSGDESLRGLLREHSEDLAQLFIVSAVDLADSGDEIRATAQKSERMDLLAAVEKAGGEKCQRCWVYSESVGDSDDFPDVCEKCVAAMSENGGR
jgi:isoleucyl-tRNA synthetase